MTATKEQMREEAIRRLEVMEKMGMHPNVLKEFKNDTHVNFSERTGVFGMPVGMLIWIDNEPLLQKVVDKFEEETGSIVYHATHEYTTFGEIFDLFYVSKYEEDWAYEFEEMGDTSLYVSVKACNLTEDWMSDFGTVGIDIVGGGAVRVL